MRRTFGSLLVPVVRIQGMGLLLGLVCDRPAAEVRDALLDHDILTGTSADPRFETVLGDYVRVANGELYDLYLRNSLVD